MSLIVRLQPYPDESLHGFLLRVSERNFAPNLKAFLGSYGLKYRLTFREDELAKLGKLLEIDSDVFIPLQPAHDSRNPLLHPKYLDRRSQKVCPHCIEESEHHRIGWDHIMLSSCPKHGLHLISTCKACGKRIDKEGPLGHCVCGQPYAQGQKSRATENSLALSAFLHGVEHPARCSLPMAWRNGEPPSEAVDFLCMLGKHLSCMNNATRGPNRVPGKAASDEVIEWANAGFDLLLDWPSRFDRALRTRLESTEGPGLAKRLGGWYRELHQRYAAPEFDCIREALVRHLSKNFDGHLNLRISTIDPQHLSDKCWLSSAEAGRLIGIGSELVRSAVITEEIPGKVTVKGKNRYVSIHKEVVEKVRQDRLLYLTTTEVRRRLGVSKLLYERLMQSGALHKQTKVQRPPLVSAEFLAQDVDALVERLRGGLQPQGVDKSRWTGLQDISVKRGIPDTAICGIIQKILHQEILPIALVPDVPGISGLRFDLGEIKACLDDQVSEPLLSITQLARIQAWKHESIKEWIEAGYLEARREVVSGRANWVIPMSALLKFMSEYVVLADIARRMESKSVWILRGLMPSGVKPALSPQSFQGTTRGVLLSISDLVKAAQPSKRVQPEQTLTTA